MWVLHREFKLASRSSGMCLTLMEASRALNVDDVPSCRNSPDDTMTFVEYSTGTFELGYYCNKGEELGRGVGVITSMHSPTPKSRWIP